jgi:phage terminase large subunit-like protein
MPLTEAEEIELLRLAVEEEAYRAGRKLWTYYPEAGPLRRELYAKHMQFFAAGKHHRERAAIAANRVGKTEGLGAYETALHLTGLYHRDDFAWWPGRKWSRPINTLCGGDTGTTTRDIIVAKLLGPASARGTGLIPKDMIKRIKPATGIPDGVDYAEIEHVKGGRSIVQFRSYDQGRKAWQGTERDLGWEDEEPPEEIHTELLLRTMTTGGMVMCTFTPLEGVSNVVMSFLPALEQTLGLAA